MNPLLDIDLDTDQKSGSSFPPRTEVGLGRISQPPLQHRTRCAGFVPNHCNMLYEGEGSLSPKPQTFKVAFILRENMAGYEEYTTISRIHFKAFAIQRVKLSAAPQRPLLISPTHCHRKSTAPAQQSGAARLPFQRVPSPVRNPDDTFSTAQQSLGLQVNFHKTGKGSYFDGFPPSQQFSHLHKH